jgi:hypothetical protein
VGSSPTDDDHDDDGLDDGIEDILETDATDDDTDGDDLPDGFEVMMFINPLSNDTDNDGVSDSVELDLGMNPRSGDSDGDGVPDKLDTDHEIVLEGTVIVCKDEGYDPAGTVADLADMTNVDEVTPEELLREHKDARYIVLIGNPLSAEGTAGAIIGDLLEDAPYLREMMTTTEEAHLVVRYGTWAREQTIVMLSSTYASDQYRVIGILRSMRVRVTDEALSFEHLAPRACFSMDGVDTVLATDAAVYAKLDGMLTFSTSISGYDERDTPRRLTADNGLPKGGASIGKYVKVEVSDDVQDGTEDNIDYAIVWLYYSVDDLDGTGDGDAEDPLDIDESTLSMYVYDAGEGMWTQLTEDLEWVNEVGLNTTDTEVYGLSYAGYLWVNVTHLSLFTAGGELLTDVVTTARPGPAITVKVGEEAIFDGSASEGTGGITRYEWRFKYAWETIVLHGEEAAFTFEKPGTYKVSLTIRDGLGGIDSATFNVTVEPEKVKVRVGPVVREDSPGSNVSTSIHGARVRVDWGEFEAVASTGFSGIADVLLPFDAIGEDIHIRITAKGFEPQEYTTTFDGTGELERQPGPMVASEVSEPPPAEGEGPESWEWAIVVLALVLVLLGLLLVVRGGSRTKDKEGEKD